jgi:uncharacterized protein YgiM (DUF1202 family)
VTQTLPRLTLPTRSLGLGMLAAAVLVGGLILAPDRTDAQDATATFAVGESVVVDTDGLNLRTEPTVDASVVQTLADGTWATVSDGPIEADGSVWYALDVDGTTGWSAGEFLSPATADASLLPVGTVVFVATDALNLRADAGLSADVVGTLAIGDQATVLSGPVEADGSFWYQLDVDGNTGWAVRDYLAFAGPDVDVFPTGAVLVVNTDLLSLRDSPSLAGGVIASLPGATQVTVVSGPESVDGFNWYEVETTEGTGWIAGEFLRQA